MSSITQSLPDGLESYGRSGDFTHDNLPQKLQYAHTTKPGTWGLIHVLDGRIHFQLESPACAEMFAATGETIVIEPEAPHRVRFVEPGRFYIEFYRRAAAS